MNNFKEAEEHQELIKEIKGYKICKVTRCDLTPENVGMTILRTPDNKEYPFNSLEEAEEFLERYVF